MPAILQVIPNLDTGGAERATIDVTRALTKAGFRALVASEGGRLEDELEKAGGTLIRLPAASKRPHVLIANIGRLANIIRDNDVGVIHARSRAPAWSAYFAARRTNIPFVTTYHGAYNVGNSLKRFYNSVMARGDIVIANSKWTAQHIRKESPVQPKRIAIIARGIALESFDPSNIEAERLASLRKTFGIPRGRKIVLLPGRLTRWKGQVILIDALARLKSQNRLWNTVAVLAGDVQGRFDYRLELQRRIISAGLEDDIVLTGHVADMPALYASADIVVSASTEPEAFGRVAAEAAAMEKPVIATDHGGAHETVLPDESGLLVPPGDVAALADGLAWLLAAPPEVLAEMGQRGRDHVAAHFTVERMCAHTLAVYRDAMRFKADERS